MILYHKLVGTNSLSHIYRSVHELMKRSNITVPLANRFINGQELDLSALIEKEIIIFEIKGDRDDKNRISFPWETNGILLDSWFYSC